MTDKQIIINGVDCSQCEYYNPNIKMDCLLHPLQSGACKNNPNCYYKQLKRKEQECEELKEKINYMEEYVKTVENARNEFEKESKFLKAEKEQAEQKLKKVKEFATALCYTVMSDGLVTLQKDILQIIDEVE